MNYDYTKDFNIISDDYSYGLIKSNSSNKFKPKLNPVNEIPDIICEECNKKDESVKQNLILTRYKVCNSCKISKTIFPV